MHDLLIAQAKIDTGDTAWMLVATALVVLMTGFTTLIAPPLLRFAFGAAVTEQQHLPSEQKTAV